MFEDAVDYLNKERNVSFTPKSAGIYMGEIYVGGEKVKLNIDLEQGFPRRFPSISVVDSARFVPHSSSGKLCLFDESSVMIKQDMPEQTLIDSYDRAIEILKMDRATQKEEVFREFFAYWNNHTNSGMIIYTNLSAASNHEYQEYTAIGSRINQLIVSDSIDESQTLLVNHMGCSMESTETYKIPCYRIRLRASSLPVMNKEFTWKNIRNFIYNNITGSQKRSFNQMLSEKIKAVNRLILLTIPSPYGDQYACLWIHRNSKNQRMNSLRNISDCRIEAVPIFRIDPQYLLIRGGAVSDIREKSVLLIGCGSVGGYLAENLCQCGIGSLDILDKDRLSLDNVHRHVLGFNDAVTGQYKADLLKKDLESRFPYVNIDSLNYVDRTAEAFITEPNRFTSYDLIVSATGNPTIDLEINDVLFKLENAPPFIACFNEPYGIGGHAIAILKNGGCLRCLYSDPISGELTAFQGSFVKEGQSFSKTISGCSSAFVEYSVLDSQQTAIVASRLIIDCLEEKCDHTRLVSWIGSAERLRTEGFQTSEYYEDLIRNEKAIVIRNIPNVKRCHTCGS